MVGVLTLVINGGLALLIAGIYDQSLVELKLSSTEASAKGIALALAPGKSTNWSDFPWATLERATVMGEFTSVVVVDTKGRVVRQIGEQPTSRDMSGLRAALVGGRVEVSFDGRRVSVVAPILGHQIVVGAVCLVGSVQHLTSARVTAQKWVLMALGVSIFLISLFIFYYLNDRLVKPLRELATDLVALKDDHFEPHPHLGISREMKTLFTTFDQTARELVEGRRRLVDQVRTISETRAKLVASEKMVTVGQMAAGLAHELGNPIGALTGFIHLLGQDDLDPQDKKNILEHSASELVRMDGYLKELLHFSRPTPPTVEEVDALAVAEVALSLARPQKWGVGVDFYLETQEPTPVVMAERNGLLQVLLNLLANAGQALSQTENPQVTLSIGAIDENGCRSLGVTDNGPGVRPADFDRLFDPYFTSKEPHQGTGLGLSVSQFIIKGFHGKLECTPVPGGGSCFTITLPVTPGEAGPQDQTPKVEDDDT